MDLTIREPAVAGAFYPSAKEELKEAVNFFLKESEKKFKKLNLQNRKLKAIIVPHAGYIYSGTIMAAGFNLIKKHPLINPKILLIGPSHNEYFKGLTIPSTKEWETPLGLVKIDPLTNIIADENPNMVFFSDEAHSSEHCLEVEIPFMQEIFSNFTLIPLLTGEGDPAKYARIIKEYQNKIDLIIVSSDLSHYNPYDYANIIDNISNKTIISYDFPNSKYKIDACGKQGILTLMYLAKEKNWHPELIDYKNSGDTAGDKKSVVGYSCIAFYEK